MTRSAFAFPLCLVAISGVACESDQISRGEDPPVMQMEMPNPPPPDAGVAVTVPPDAGMVITEPPDAGVPVASEPVYLNTGETLYAFDPSTGRASSRGNFASDRGEVTGMVDIAIDLQGHMYGGTTERELFQIDPTNAHCTLLASYSDILHGLTFLSDGRLVVAGHAVAIVDPETGRTLDTLVPEGEYETSGDIIGLPDGKLYWSVRGERDQPDDIVRIDPQTKRTEVLGSTGVVAIYGLGYADQVLYGFLRDGERVELDQRSGRAIDERPLSGRWYGATTNPVLW